MKNDKTIFFPIWNDIFQQNNKKKVWISVEWNDNIEGTEFFSSTKWATEASDNHF